MKLSELLRLEPPPNFRMPRERTSAGAWSIHQDALKLLFKWQRLRGVELNNPDVSQTKARKLIAHSPQPVCMMIRRNNHAFFSRGAD